MMGSWCKVAESSGGSGVNGEFGGGVVEGQVGAGGAEGHVAGVEVAEPGPGLVWSVDCRAFANLL